MINKDHVRSKFTIHIIKCEYNEIYPRGLSKKLAILNVIIFFKQAAFQSVYLMHSGFARWQPDAVQYRLPKENLSCQKKKK